MIIKYTIDRIEIEEKIAYCEDENGNIAEIEFSLLPDGSSEGDIVVSEDGVIRIDREATEERRNRIREKMKGLWKK